MRYKVWGIRMAIETHPGGRLSTHASRRHILGFRKGYARRCDYDYRPRLGLNMGGGRMDDEQRTYNMNMKKNQPGPQQKEKVGKRKDGDRAQVRNITSDIRKHASSKKKSRQDEQTGLGSKNLVDAQHRSKRRRGPSEVVPGHHLVETKETHGRAFVVIRSTLERVGEFLPEL